MPCPDCCSKYGPALDSAGGLYALAGRAHGGSGDTCVGSDCFGTTFAVAAVLAALTALLAAWLAARSRRLYQRTPQLEGLATLRTRVAEEA